jgi:hypothetical protein
VALYESIRIISDIDKIIDAHGGWLGAFATNRADSKSESPAQFPLFAADRGFEYAKIHKQ